MNNEFQLLYFTRTKIDDIVYLVYAEFRSQIQNSVSPIIFIQESHIPEIGLI